MNFIERGFLFQALSIWIMKNQRDIRIIKASQPVIEGAGVKLQRVFGHGETKILDPFLLLDHFGSDNPDDYIAGFPWHPHRGIETVTYMKNGKVKHEDSLGNAGTIGTGDIQWMTAGSGIIHQEMPKRTNGILEGFQLWVNLPSYVKMMDPRYQDISSTQVPEIVQDDGITVRVLAGTYNGIEGPVKDIIADPEYLDISLPSQIEFKHPVKDGYTIFAYIYDGEGFFGSEKKVMKGNIIIFEKTGDYVKINTRKEKMQFLLISGKPIKEPIAWAGPIVMNTQEEVHQAFEEYRMGNFLKQRS
jgi:redox-sensitive bicupin YhaK (pirin superfamily)